MWGVRAGRRTPLLGAERRTEPASGDAGKLELV
jgi:hypothetical protein